MREKYNEDNFLNKTTMTVASVTLYTILHILCERRKESTDVCIMTQQHKRKLTQQHRRKMTQQRRQNNHNIAEAIITHS
jgi:hypothetical protein